MSVAVPESTEDLDLERLILLCLEIPTIWFARFKGKRTPDKILLPLFVIVKQSYVCTFYNNNCSYK